MIRHIHFNRWKPDTSTEEIAKVFDVLADFPKRFPEIRAMELYSDAKLGPATSGVKNFDFAIILDFDDEAAFRKYIGRTDHHTVVATYIKPIQEAVARIQFVVPDPAE